MSELGDIVARGRLSERTKHAYTKSIERFERFAGPSRSPVVVERWRDHLRESGLSPRTVNRHLYALRYATRRLEALGLAPDFARAAESFKVAERRQESALTLAEASALLATCRGGSPHDLRDQAAIVTGIRTGARVSELVQLEWHQIQGRRARVIAKGGGELELVLDDETLRALARWGEWLHGQIRLRGAVFRGIGPDRGGSRAIYPGLSRQKLHAAVAARGKLAGIARPIHPHVFRHTFITWALEAGVPPQRIMIQTGQKSLATLSKYVTDLRAADDPVAGYLPPLLR